MTVSQRLNHLNESNYDDDITVTDVPQSYFLAVTANSIAPGATTREMRVDLFPLEQAPGGTRSVNSGLYVRSQDETAVKVTVYQNNQEVASNTQDYS